MSKIKFIYEKNIFEMIFEDKDSIESILEKYVKILSIKKKDLLFLYKGLNISLIEYKEQLYKFKNKNIIILVYNLNKIKDKKKN